MTRSRTRRLAGLGLAALAFAGAAAMAAPVTIENVDLTGGGTTVWDASNSDTAYCTQAEDSGSAFAPVDEGYANGNGDAFDGGMLLVIGNKAFVDGDGEGSQKGQTLKAGPDPLKGLKVTVKAAALQDSPTLQVLYALKNPTAHRVSTGPIIESNLGSDDVGTAIAGTSSGDENFRPQDRWVVTEDTVMDDGPVTHVLYGKQANGVDAVIAAPTKECDESENQYEDGVAVRYSVQIPAHSTRYLLAFAELHESSTDDALDSVKKFNDPKLSKKLLKGISEKVQAKILNWDL